MEVKVQIVKRETITPSSPTPTELRSFQLSVFDQINPAIYTPLLLFYADQHDGQLAPDEKSQRLKLSLSETLTRFYPLAGRITNNFSIECADQGVEFVEAEVDCCLSDILKQPSMVALESLLPVPVGYQEARDGHLLYLQANFFKEGGIVIGVSISHKISDASTLSTFVKAWSTKARGSSELILPDFRISKLFPPVDFMSSVPTVDPVRNESITRRFVVESSRIESLRARAASDDVPRPTRVEAVTALVWKAAATASRKNSDLAGSSPKKTGMSQIVNLRKRVNPPLPDTSVGNMAGFFAAQTEDTELTLQNLVCHLRKGIQEYKREFVEHLVGDRRVPAILEVARDYGALWMDEQVDHFNCSSWYRFPLYEADFGWGKPAWASIASSEFPRNFILLSTPDGEGIEAWLPLSKEDMALVERDEELLEFASLDPAVEC